MTRLTHEDARSIPAAAQEEKRKLAINLRQQGKTYKDIADTVGVHHLTVGIWVRAWQAQGNSGLKNKTKGRPKRSGRIFTQEQETRLIKLLTDKTPDQLKLSYALWTRQSVQAVIKQEFGIEIARSTIGKYLQQWGFSLQKPLTKAYEQNPKCVDKWLKEDYPAIANKAKAENAEIHWGDETGIRNDCQHERGYSPIGKTPVIKLNVKRAKLNMISTVTNQGKVRFKTYQGSMNAEVLIDFFKRLIKDSNKKIILILDNLRVHHAKVVKAWLEDKVDKIEVFYLPAYSPELNPDEYLNCDLKCGVHSGLPARTQKELNKKTCSHMRMLQRNPERVKTYFRHPSIQYAA